MNILIAAAAIAAAQTAPAANPHAGHAQHQHGQHQQAQHQQGQHAQHQGEHKCCKQVDGKMQCQMMKGHGGDHQGHGQQQGQSGHSH